jgi:hypothetical protein
MRRQRDADWRPVEAHHVDAAEFMHLMTHGRRKTRSYRGPCAPLALLMHQTQKQSWIVNFMRVSRSAIAKKACFTSNLSPPVGSARDAVPGQRIAFQFRSYGRHRQGPQPVSPTTTAEDAQGVRM